jgi:hypothetical protein
MEDFDFPAAMRKVREGLEKLLVEYAAEHPEVGYRDLGEKFNLSLGALSKIMTRWKTLRRNIKRYKGHLRKVERELGGLIPKRTAQKAGNDVRRPLSRAPSGVPAAPDSAVPAPPSHYFASEDVEFALTTLDRCVVNGRADDAGEDAYQTLSDWLRKGKGTIPLLQRAGYLTQRYETLRSKKWD